MYRGLHGISFFALSIGLCAPTFAQEADVTAPTPAASTSQMPQTASYDAAFFAPSAPQTALDIARLVPGFTLELGDLDVRGFAQAAEIGRAHV